jgi:hypothetical protein
LAAIVVLAIIGFRHTLPSALRLLRLATTKHVFEDLTERIVACIRLWRLTWPLAAAPGRPASSFP